MGEPIISDMIVSGVDSITDIGGGLIRVVFYINLNLTERILFPHAIVMPKCMVADAIGKSMMAIGRKVIARPDGSLTVAH